MARKIINARIQQRTDSRANWEEFNPVLLEGEMGLIREDRSLYKVGDGVTPWKDLPYRGFNGNIAQETGGSRDAVMSQAAVTEELNSLGEKLSRKMDKTDFATVAKTGKYGDLQDLPDFATINGKRIDQGGELVIDPDTVYNPGATGETVQDFGDIKAGTTAADLKGRSYDEMFDAILFPTVYPSFTAPSAYLALTGASLREVDEKAPSLSDLAVTFSRGAIMLMGEQQAPRSGSQEVSKSFVFIGGSVANKALPETVALGSTQYNYRAYYGEGPQPYDNKGNAYDAPLPAGYVDSNVVTVYGTYPWFATTAGASGGTPTKQALIRWNATAGAMTTPEFTLLPTDTCAQVISTPREIAEIYIKDTTSGNFILSDLTGFEKTTETRSGRTYYRYTYTGGGRGEITLKIKF